MANPEAGGRYYLIDDAHIPASEVELAGDPYDVGWVEPSEPEPAPEPEPTPDPAPEEP